MSSSLPDGPDPGIRIGDAERERVRLALERHTADGRLTLDEYEDRLGQVYAAQTAPELSAALRDLPELPAAALPRPAAQASAARRQVRDAVVGWVALAVLFITIWAFTGAGYFWPVWPILGTGLGMLATVRAAAANPDQRRPDPRRRGQRHGGGSGGRGRP